MNVVRVLGIDPSLNNFGIAKTTINLETLNVTVESVILIQPSKADAVTKKQVRKNSDDLRRAIWLQNHMIKACKGFDMVAVEAPVGSQSARAMASYGVVIGVLASCPLPMIEVTATEVKLAGHGTKTATKDEMIVWATNLHPEANWKTIKRGGKLVITKDMEHCADALGAVYAAIDTQQFKMATAMMRRLAS